MLSFVEKSRISFLVFSAGEYFGEVECLRNEWVFFPRSGIAGTRYALGVSPRDSVERWIATNGGLK